MQASWRSLIGMVILWAGLCANRAAFGQDDWLIQTVQIEGESGRATASLSDEDAAAEPEFTDAAIEAAALWEQPPALSQPAQPARTPAPSRSLGSRQRLASMPNMFGDFGMTTATGRFVDNVGLNQIVQSELEIPGPGGSRRVKIGENNKPFPDSRVYFMYNHFQNVYQLQETQTSFFPFPATQTQTRQSSVDRYTLGFEKLVLNDTCSVEVRMPFNGALNEQLTTVGVSGGNIGNLAVILKYLCYSNDNTAVSLGLGFDTPTGSDAESRLGPLNLSIQNDSFHLLPYAGFAFTATERCFVSGFLQIDLATAGNEVIATPDGAPAQSLGQFTEQNLLFVDLSLGYWLHRNPYAERWTGMAAIAEFHYTTALQDSDTIFFAQPTGILTLNNPANRFDVVNVTGGVQVEMFNTSSLRVAAVIPTGDRPNGRFFDSEIQVQFNRRF